MDTKSQILGIVGKIFSIPSKQFCDLIFLCEKVYIHTNFFMGKKHINSQCVLILYGLFYLYMS